MRKAVAKLPNHFRLLREIDLQNNKKKMLLVNVLAVLIAAVMFLLAYWLAPVGFFFSGLGSFLLQMGLLLLGICAYMVLHELVHGLFFYLYSGQKPHYGLTGMYAYAASNAYYPKGAYLVIGLAPVVLLGLVLGVLCIAAPEGWFWYFYLLQTVNISGAAGDLYVTAVLLLRCPSNIFVLDNGASMKIYW